MRKTIRLIWLAFLLFPLANVHGQEGFITRTVVYEPGDFGSQNYRIPAIITAEDGSLVIATDKRKNNDGDLPEDIDIVINKSTDGGKTWSEPLTLAQGTGYGHGFGDCALARTNEPGGLIAAFVGGIGFWKSTADEPMHTYICKSTDNGKTWSEPRDITDYLIGSNCRFPEHRNWQSSFFASGNGLRTSTGRILFVAAVLEGDDWWANNYVFYSDDNGETWQCSGRASIGGDEAKLVELSDGRILMSVRHDTYRWYNISSDGGKTWRQQTSTWYDIPAPACNGDIIRHPGNKQTGGKSILLHSVPKGNARKDVAIFVSFDEGMTWPYSKVIIPYNAAYSSLCVLPDGTIGMYVEESNGDDRGYSMVFYNFTLDWLLR